MHFLRPQNIQTKHYKTPKERLSGLNPTTEPYNNNNNDNTRYFTLREREKKKITKYLNEKNKNKDLMCCKILVLSSVKCCNT